MGFVSLFDLCLSPLIVEFGIDADGDFAVYFEDEGFGFNYKVVKRDGLNGIDL